LSLVIENDGQPWQPGDLQPTIRRGLGLRIMRARSERIGWTLTITPGPTGGTRVICLMPLKAPFVSEEPKVEAATRSENSGELPRVSNLKSLERDK
jgi:signal transduction histidine kinase